MANPNRSEVAKTIGGKEYVFKLGTNEICNAENSVGKPFSSIISELEEGDVSLTILRTLLYFAIRKFQPKTSLEEVGELIDLMGPSEAGTLLGDCIKASYPEISEEEEEGNA
jgi:hypothetical protein